MCKKIDFSKEQIEHIILEYNNGKSCLEISKIFNVSKTPINNLLKKIDTNQFEKIKWVNKNIKPIKIFIVDKKNNKIIKKKIK